MRGENLPCGESVSDVIKIVALVSYGCDTPLVFCSAGELRNVVRQLNTVCDVSASRIPATFNTN